jgi:hypothetical protein
MINAVYVLLAVLAVAVPAFILTPVVRSWWRARGVRLVVCRRDHQPARVEPDPLEVAFLEVFHIPGQTLKSCSRWPTGSGNGCGQDCLVQISPRNARLS